MEIYMVWVWLAVFFITLVIEASTQDLISVWFSLGSIIALILSAFDFIPWYVELIIFVVVSLVALVLTRPFVKKLTLQTTRYTNIDELVGKRVKVLKDIKEFENGEVKINGIIYYASLLDDEKDTIYAGEIVEIVTFVGNRVVVKKIIE